MLKAINELRGVQPNEFDDRGLNLGVYGTVVQGGIVRVGDDLHLA